MRSDSEICIVPTSQIKDSKKCLNILKISSGYLSNKRFQKDTYFTAIIDSCLIFNRNNGCIRLKCNVVIGIFNLLRSKNTGKLPKYAFNFLNYYGKGFFIYRLNILLGFGHYFFSIC